MAKRPVFLPSASGPLVQVAEVEFMWSPGMAPSRKQLNIRALHNATEERGLGPTLEVSTKSLQELGFELSAFNLTIAHGNVQISVEAAFQGSKVFQTGGPYNDLYQRHPRDARRDPRVREGGLIRSFSWQGQEWPLTPKTAFYDWIYLSALSESPELATGLRNFASFTDIEFNPARSISCQARSCALYEALRQRGILQTAMETQHSFLDALKLDEGGNQVAWGFDER